MIDLLLWGAPIQFYNAVCLFSKGLILHCLIHFFVVVLFLQRRKPSETTTTTSNI